MPTHCRTQNREGRKCLKRKRLRQRKSIRLDAGQTIHTRSSRLRAIVLVRFAVFPEATKSMANGNPPNSDSEWPTKHDVSRKIAHSQVYRFVEVSDRVDDGIQNLVKIEGRFSARRLVESGWKTFLANGEPP
jgi:hypothetical protein